MRAVAKQPELHEHTPRRGHGISGRYLTDWQADEGAAMDAPTWQPRGSTYTTRFSTAPFGTSVWDLRSGLERPPTIAPAWQLVIVDLAGGRYRVRFEHGSIIEIRREGGRRLRSGSPLWHNVASLAIGETLR